MKQVLLLTLAMASFARLGAAANCASGALASYVGLGATGCTIGSNTLSNFKILSGINLATPISPSAITITPTGGTSNPGLTISTTQTATSGSLLEIIFTYLLSGQIYVGSTATLSGSSSTGGGAVTGIQNFCAGGAFGLDGVSNCSGNAGSLLTLAGALSSDSAAFGGASFLNVTNDLTFDAGAGTATGGTFSNSFATVSAVPEPVSTALTGLGLTVLTVFCKRRLSANQKPN
jgi:hypothetical protein